MKVHDLALRADYEIASKEHEYFFELDVSFSYTHPGSLFLSNLKNFFSFHHIHMKTFFYSIDGYSSFQDLFSIQDLWL